MYVFCNKKDPGNIDIDHIEYYEMNEFVDYLQL